jgi:hypothetical protein
MTPVAHRTRGRRAFLKAAGGALAAGFWADETLDALPQNVNTNSKPSDLKITDMRVITVTRAPMTCPLIRLDTPSALPRVSAELFDLAEAATRSASTATPRNPTIPRSTASA